METTHHSRFINVAELIVTLLFVSVCSLALGAPIEMSGVYDQQNLNLNNADGYRIIDDVTFDGIEVSIPAGRVIGFDGEFKITIRNGAVLKVNFQAPNANLVVFTNANDAAQNYGLAGWGQNNFSGEWCYLHFLTDNGDIDHFQRAKFLHGGIQHTGDDDRDYTGYILLDGEDAALRLSRCTFIGDDPVWDEWAHCGVIAADGSTLIMTDSEVSSALIGIGGFYNRNEFVFENGQTPDMTVKNCHIYNCVMGAIGIIADRGGDILIEQCLLHDINTGGAAPFSSGVWEYAGYTPRVGVDVMNLTIRNCVIYDAMWDGICITTNDNIDEHIIIENNAIFGCGDNPVASRSGLHMSLLGQDWLQFGIDCSWDVLIRNNTSWGNDRAGYQILDLGIDQAEEHFTFVNNISGNNRYGVSFITTTDEQYTIPYTAFKGNQNLIEQWDEEFDDIVLDQTCLIFEEGDHFSLVNESPSEDQWDFHLLIDNIEKDQEGYLTDLNCRTLNAGYIGAGARRNWADADRWLSIPDFGIFGGPFSRMNIDVNQNLLDDYVLVTDERFLQVLHSLPISGMDVYRLSWEGIGNAAGQYCQLIQMDVHADEPLQINGALLANSVFFNVGLVFSSSTNIGSSNFFDCTVMNASYGLYLSGVDDLFGDRLPITNCTFTDCGVGVYANNSRLLLDNCTITGSNAATTAGAGVYLSNCGLGKVIIDGCTINENGTGSTISSSGIYLSSSSPEIIWTEVKDNSGGGIYCSGSTPDLDTYDYLLLNDQPNSIESNGGLVQTGSDGAEIYFASSSYPAIKYNNITDGSPPVGYLIYKDQTSNMYGVTATNNYWGGTPSDSWFYWGTGLAIDYSNSSTTRLSSAEEFEYAMSLWNEGDFTGAAEAFAECIADTGDIGIKAVHYLSGCTGQMERRDYDGLREFLLDAADGHADARVGKVAARFATDCLTQQGLFDEAMEEFDAARANAECLEDSVLAVVDWLAVYELANGGDLDAAERDIAGRTSGLLGLLSGGRNGASAVLPEEVILASCYPNPFNATTTLTFSLPEASDVRLSVFDLSGREVASLENGKLEAGNHSATWNAEGFTSGIYFVKIETPAFSATRKVTLVR